MFYKKLQQLCVEKGVSMQRVAADIGVSPAAISKWRKGGKPSNANVKALAEYFGTDVAAFLDADAETTLSSSEKIAPASNLVDAYAGLRKDYDDFRAIVQSQQTTIQTLSETGKNFSLTSVSLADVSKNLSESQKNLSVSNRNLSESIKHLATKGSLAKSRGAGR